MSGSRFSKLTSAARNARMARVTGYFTVVIGALEFTRLSADFSRVPPAWARLGLRCAFEKTCGEIWSQERAGGAVDE
jgi:hypothetical protein